MSRAWLAALLLAVAGATVVQTAVAADEGPAYPRLAAMAPQVLARGPQANLPAHLARVLGLSDKGPVPVRQAVQRHAGDVHVFNVLEPGAHAVVLMRVGEASARTEAFLLDAQGALLRAVRYEGGGEAQDLPAADAAKAFGREAQFWLDISTHPK